MANELTPQQAQAVQDRGGKLLVSAAAGSGKTKVLVDRLLSYLTDPVAPADLDEFLIITYTKAAAAELRGKIAAKLSERIAEDPENRHLQQQLQRLFLTKISTVHSFCTDLLRENAYRLDLSADFRVADENECRELRQVTLDQLLNEAFAQPDADFRAFVDTQGLGRNDRLVPEIIQKVYDSARCHLDPEGWLQACGENVDVSELSDPSQTPWGKFLMEDLFAWLDDQIPAVEACRNVLLSYTQFPKLAANLGDLLHQLVYLRQSNSWDEIHNRKNLEFGRLTFSPKFPDPEIKDQVKAVREACKKSAEKKLRSFADPAERVMEDLEGITPGVRGMIRLVREFSARYDQAKQSRNVLDFGDLEHRTLDLLLGKQRSGPTAVARETGQRYREILVDEYQDSNGVQDAIFSALTQQRQNLFMVGDVKQSIYQFRLADPGIFLEKYAQYVPAETAQPGQGRKVLLSRNFRSGGAVISAVNDVFRRCMSQRVGGLEYGDAEALYEHPPHEPLGEPEVELHLVSVKEQTYPEEAAFVADRIRTLLDGTHFVRKKDGLRPILPEDIVILLRSPGSVGAEFQRALERIGIRCTSGNGSDLLQAPEIHALRSLLQTISNPRQDIPLLAALTSPVFGFTADDLARIRGGNKKVPIYDALRMDEDPKSQEFIRILSVLRREARMHPLSRLLETIFRLTRMDLIYGAMTDGEVRRANLHSFFRLAADYESGMHRDLEQFLQHLEALEEKGIPMSADPGAGAVTIMSIHKSKGLEYPVVFLCGLSREFNRESIRAQVLCHRDLGLGPSCVDVKNRIRYPSTAKRAIAVKTVQESLSEELRVLYVAMTRARDRLIMTYASRNPEDDLTTLSQRMDLCKKELMTSEVVCPGEWLLYEALHRMEAGVLHQLGGRPKELRISEHPWKICVSEAPASVGLAMEPEKAPEEISREILEEISAALAFHYGHMEATVTPSKQTATALKGREKDQEVAENTREDRGNRIWRKPDFGQKAGLGKAYGSAVHKALQYLDFERCSDPSAVAAEVERLVVDGLLTPEESSMIDCRKLADFFSTELGKQLRTGEVLREFKFSILVDAARYGDGLAGEQILLQGVVDCALLEPDGITLVDFKTDYVTEETLEEITQRYQPQVEAYAHALNRIYGKPIKAAYLYFFHLDRFVPICG